jgi:hypothetical protein
MLDERAGIYVTSIPGCARWFDSSDSIETLSLEDTAVLKGDKDRIVARGQTEIGVVVRCYAGLENTVKVCDLVEIIGILEMPEDQTEDEEDSSEVVIHAVTLQKRQLNDIILAKHGRLSSGRLPFDDTDL